MYISRSMPNLSMCVSKQREHEQNADLPDRPTVNIVIVCHTGKCE